MNSTETFDIDHLHPQSAFTKKALEASDFLRQDMILLEFYSDANHWNSIANLHLLNYSQNRSKNSKTLSQWVSEEVSVNKRS